MIRAKLLHEWSEAVRRADSANEEFSAITGNIPSGAPHPDGVRRIHNASHKLTEAREQFHPAYIPEFAIITF